MRIVSILENQKIEKRIAITPDIAKKYIALGFNISIVEKYGEHLGFTDSDYKDLGVEISTNKSEVLNSADIVIQLGLLPDENLSNLKANQIFIGVLNPFANKEKIQIITPLHLAALFGCLDFCHQVNWRNYGPYHGKEC